MLSLFYQGDIKTNGRHEKAILEAYSNKVILFLNLDMFALHHLLSFVLFSKIIAYIDNIEEKH
jgi:hypothetical protein